MKRPKILVVGSINMDLFVEGANIMVMLLVAKALIRPLQLLNRERTSYL